MSTAVELPEPTEQEVGELAEVLTEAHMKGIRHGHWTLARFILAAGYRRTPEPEPVRYGQCRVCKGSIPLGEGGTLVEHEDQRQRSRPCVGGSMTPERMADPPEVASADD